MLRSPHKTPHAGIPGNRTLSRGNDYVYFYATAFDFPSVSLPPRQGNAWFGVPAGSQPPGLRRLALGQPLDGGRAVSALTLSRGRHPETSPAVCQPVRPAANWAKLKRVSRTWNIIKQLRGMGTS